MKKVSICGTGRRRIIGLMDLKAGGYSLNMPSGGNFFIYGVALQQLFPLPCDI